MMQKGLTIAGCVCWIAGLILFVVGLNLAGSTKDWLTIIGSIIFLIGLGITGAIWMKKKKDENT